MQSETLSFQLTSQIQSLTQLCMVLPHTMNVISHPLTRHNNFIFFDISVHRPSPLLFPSIQNVPPTVDRCSYTDIILYSISTLSEQESYQSRAHFNYLKIGEILIFVGKFWLTFLVDNIMLDTYHPYIVSVK